MFFGNGNSTKQIFLHQQRGNNNADKYLAVIDMLQTEGEDREYDINTRKLSFINGSVQIGLADSDHSSLFQVSADTDNSTVVIKTKSGSNAQLILDIYPSLATGNGFQNALTQYRKDGVTKWMTGLNSITGGSNDEFVIANGSSFDLDYILNITHSDGFVGIGKQLPTARAHIKSDGTLGTNEAFIIENADTSNNKLWSWRSNGDLYQGADSGHYLQGNDYTFKKSLGLGNQDLIIEEQGNFSKGWILKNINGVVDECYSQITTGQVGFDGTELSHNIINGTFTAKGCLKSLISGFRFDVSANDTTYNKRLTHRYSESFGNTNTEIDFHYSHRPSWGYIQSMSISGTYTASDYITIRTDLNYIFDINNSIGYNVGIGTIGTPLAKLHVNGDTIIEDQITLNQKVLMTNLPTSSAGLSPGELWNDAGTIKIV
jgi:hypothetical protein